MLNLPAYAPYSLSRCPLCEGARVPLYRALSKGVPWHLYGPEGLSRDALRFYRCEECALVIKDPSVRATPSQERAHYEKHNNDLTNSGYRDHLLKLVVPLLTVLPSDALGLDYGCGPVLSIEPLMRERGQRCVSFDPIFFPQEELLTPNTYDFITCCEVPEHFKEPRLEFSRLHEMVKRGGVLGIVTKPVPDEFEGWWYHRDPTHLVFYSERTFAWLADHFDFELMELRGDVVLTRKR